MAERYGDYELVRKIATGGMAEIYLARLVSEQGFGRPVVVKRMLPQLAVRDDFVTMFLDEARLAANLVHPNIVQVFNLGQTDGSYFMAMELIDGPHLGALFAHSLRQRKPLPIEFCVYAVARAADGLEYSHNLKDPATGKPVNIVHRDISPQNVLVSRHGDVKVTDFGVAKADTQEAKTRTGIIKGKVSYMSPEQCLGEIVDRRTDVFALGIVLYELLTRRRLFRDKSDLLVMQRITKGEVKPPSVLNKKVDELLDEVTLKSLARMRDDRYASAADLSEQLDYWLATNGHVDCRGKLAAWMAEHAPHLGLSLDEADSKAAQPAWADIGPGPAPAAAPPRREPTASTPALDATRVTAEADEAARAAQERSTVDITAEGEAVERPEATQTQAHVDEDLFPSGEEKTDADAAAMADNDLAAPAPLTGARHLEQIFSEEAPPVSTRRGLPKAALMGLAAGLALLVALIVFTFLGGDDDTLAQGTGIPSDIETVDGTDGPAGNNDANTNGEKQPQDPSDPPPPADDQNQPDEQPNGQPQDGKQPDDVQPPETDETTPTAVAAEKTGTLTLKTVPAGATLSIDGEPAEVGTIELPLGRHVIVAQFKSDKVTKTVRLTADGKELTVVAPPRIEVTTKPSGAQIRFSFGGHTIRTKSSSPYLLDLSKPISQVSVEATKRDYERATKKIDIKPGELTRVQLTLKKKRSSNNTTRKPPPAPPGKIKIYARPYVNVRLEAPNGQRQTKVTPVVNVPVRSGTQTLLISNPEFGIKDRVRISVKPNGTTTVKLEYQDKGGKYVRAGKPAVTHSP